MSQLLRERGRIRGPPEGRCRKFLYMGNFAMIKNTVYCALVLMISFNSLCCTPKTRPNTPVDKPPVLIILSPEASEAERWSAKEMATAIREMTGQSVKMKTITDFKSIPADSLCFLLGVLDKSPALKSLIGSGDLSIPKGRPKFDGFVLKSVKKDGRNILVIAGKKPRGVLNGVFHLLERVWHCGFFEDAFETVRYPKYKTLPVPAVDKIIEPVFEHREVIYIANYSNNFWSSSRQYKNMDYLARLRYNRYTHNWGLYSAAFAKELYDRGKIKRDIPLPYWPLKQGDKDYVTYFENTANLLKYWHSHGGAVTIRKPCVGLEGALSIVAMNQAYPGHLGFKWRERNKHYNPNDDLVMEIDIAAIRKLQTRIGLDGVGDWYEIGLPCEHKSWGTEKDRRNFMLNFVKAGIRTLKEVDPKGKLALNSWTLLFSPWTANDFRAIFDMITSKGKEIVVYDIMALDGVPTHQKYNYYSGHPWLVGAIPQIATVDELQLNMPRALKMAQELARDARTNPGNNLIGFCYQTEGSGGMPMTMDFLHMLAWNPLEWTIETYIRDYAVRRYGRENAPAMIPALNKLMNSVYSPKTKLLWGRYHVCAPHKGRIRVGNYLDAEACRARVLLVPVVREALVKALDAEPVLKDDPYYILDLIDIARMYCYYSEEIWISKAWNSVKTSDAKGLEEAEKAFDVIFESLTRLLATHPRYWNKSAAYGYVGNDYYANDTYELLKHLYSVRVNKQLELFKDLIVQKKDKWPLKEALAWRTKMTGETRESYNNGPAEWKNIPKSEQYPMSVVEAVKKLLVDVSRANGFEKK